MMAIAALSLGLFTVGIHGTSLSIDQNKIGLR